MFCKCLVVVPSIDSVFVLTKMFEVLSCTYTAAATDVATPADVSSTYNSAEPCWPPFLVTMFWLLVCLAVLPQFQVKFPRFIQTIMISLCYGYKACDKQINQLYEQSSAGPGAASGRCLQSRG